ncbi:MAG TPA: alpha/beta hydrolase [Myxococcaceae bacterium]|nr:alpha/beta hydrolase [Myxococcaceae bacterium]
MQHHHADLNGIRMHYVTQGEGRPVLLLHGFPEYWGVWKKVMAELAKDHFVIAPDMRGYNLTSKPREVEQYRMEHLMADVRALGEHLGLKQLDIVAQDQGAALGWCFAVHHPEWVRRYVTINFTHPAILNRELRHNPRQQQASQYMLLFHTPQGEAMLTADDYAWPRQALLEDARKHGAELSAEDEAEWLSAWKQPGAITGGLNGYRAAKVGPPDGKGSPGGSNLLEGLTPEQLVVRVPVLFIQGEEDPFLLPESLQGLEELVPDLTFRRIPGASHWVTLERPDLVSQHVREFLARS